MPRAPSSRRMILASGHTCVLERSAMRNAEGSSLLPAPIAEMMGVFAALARQISSTLFSSATICSMRSTRSKTGAASTIAHSIIRALGEKYIYLALALSAMILTGMGVFIDVAVITIAPIAIIMGNKLQLSPLKLLLAMIGGGKCGNILSPNPNTIIAAENFNAPLSSVMAAGIVPAIIGLVITVFVIIPLIPEKAKGDKVRGECFAYLFAGR